MFAPMTAPARPNGHPGRAETEAVWVFPVPDNAPAPPPMRGVCRWWYRDVEGRLLFAVERYEPRRDGERKQFVPLTLPGWKMSLVGRQSYTIGSTRSPVASGLLLTVMT